MADVRPLIDAVAAGTPVRAAVLKELSLDALPHGWRDSDKSGSRIKVLYNPEVPSKKGHFVRFDAQKGGWTYFHRGAQVAQGSTPAELLAYLDRQHKQEAKDDTFAGKTGAGNIAGTKKVKPKDIPWCVCHGYTYAGCPCPKK